MTGKKCRIFSSGLSRDWLKVQRELCAQKRRRSVYMDKYQSIFPERTGWT